jgi:hypothetical protein
MKSQLLNGSVDGTVAYARPSGWMDASLFLKFMERLIKCEHVTKEKPLVLILDDHASHESLKAIELAGNSGIVILSVPRHTTQKLQVRDVGIFGPFKTMWLKGWNCRRQTILK